MEKNRNRTIIIVSVVVVLILMSLVVYVVQRTTVKSTSTGEVGTASTDKPEDSYMKVRVYYPSEDKLRLEERTISRVFSQKKILREALLELLKGSPDVKRNIIPDNSILLGLYIGNDGIAYLNFSEDFKRNFHGDVLDEYLILKAIYETVLANSKVDDVRILIDDKETDSVGGHFSAEYPLKQLVARELKLD